MIAIAYSRRALADLERLTAFLLEEHQQAAAAAVRAMIEDIRVLERHPYIGRRVRGELRELVIGYGRAGYVAMYRATLGGVQVLAIRRQREAGTIHQA